MSLVLGLAAAQFASGLMQSQDIMDQAELSGRISEFNAESLELDAFKAEEFGFTQSARYKSVIDKTIGSQRAGFAGQGVDVSTGTAAIIQAESKLNGFLNQLDIQQAGRNQAKGIRQKASSVRLAGIMGEAQSIINASTARVGATIDAGRTLFAGYRAGDL